MSKMKDLLAEILEYADDEKQAEEWIEKMSKLDQAMLTTRPLYAEHTWKSMKEFEKSFDLDEFLDHEAEELKRLGALVEIDDFGRNFWMLSYWAQCWLRLSYVENYYAPQEEPNHD